MEPTLIFFAVLIALAFWAGWSARGIRDRTDMPLDEQIAEYRRQRAGMEPLQKAMRRAEIASPLVIEAVPQADFRPPARPPIGACVLCDHGIPHERHA